MDPIDADFVLAATLSQDWLMPNAAPATTTMRISAAAVCLRRRRACRRAARRARVRSRRVLSLLDGIVGRIPGGSPDRSAEARATRGARYR